jgi:hypothetical protein
VPDENPKDVVARIDAELADEDEDTAKDYSSDDIAAMNGHGKAGGGSAEWDFSGWPMLLLLMPPIGFVTIAQPIMNAYVDRRLLGSIAPAEISLPIILDNDSLCV